MSQANNANGHQRAKRRIASRLSLAGLLQLWLDQNRTTAYALAHKAGINRSILSKILSGMQRFVSPETISRLAVATKYEEAKLWQSHRNTHSVVADSAITQTRTRRNVRH
jgi:transcriptional regulator with XRE-family HTH domain